MERRDKENHVQWPFMVKSPDSSLEQFHELYSRQNLSFKNYLSQNPTTLNHDSHNLHSLDHHLLQNPNSRIPITTQNHHNNNLLWLEEDQFPYHMNPLQYHGLGSLEPNPSLRDGNIESSLARLSLSSRFPSIDITYRQQQSALHRMRVEAAVRGQMGTPWISSDDLRMLSRSSDDTQNLVAAMNRSAISCPNISNDSYADQYNIRANAIRLDSRFQNTRSPRSLSGPESDHVSTVLLSSLLNNHQNAKPQRRPSNYSSLDELKGRLFTVAKEQQGCRFLQHIVEENKPEDIEMIFMEVKEVVHELMVDPVANYLIQKLIEACNEQQMNGMVLSLVCDEEKLMNICGHSHGTRVIQKLLEHVTTREQKSLIISALKCITVTLTKSMHGHHVIQQCFRQFSNEEAKPLLDDIAENCLDIATDKSGCCVLQQCVAHAEGESRERLISEIIPNSLILAEHPYGNYVVQYLLGMKIPRVSENILDQLKGSYVNLSMNKYGSNVVEKCLKECGEKESATITMELINDPGCLKVLLDPYGNYVVQSALSVSKGEVLNTLVSFIHCHYPYLHSHLYGKKVLAKTRGNKHRV